MADGERTGGDRAALIYNPTKVDASKLRARVEQLSLAAGWQHPLFFQTTPEDLGQGGTARALAADACAILVAGGDGTVRAVAEALAGTGVQLSIVPSGTGNLFARNMGLPLADPDAMIQATFSGDMRDIDIASALLVREDGTQEEHGFVVMGGIGLDATMIANTNPQLKKAMGWVAYVDGAARSLPKAKPFRVLYQMVGHRMHSAKVHSILFANGGMLPAGIDLIPDASIIDGEMDVAVIQPRGWFGWLAVWRRVWWDNSVLRRTRTGRRIAGRRKDSSVVYLRGTELDAACDMPQPVELDGDEFGEAVRLHCRIRPGALRVAVPHGHRIPGRPE